MKKFVSLVLILFLLASAIPCFAQEVDSTNVQLIPLVPPTTFFSFASDTFHSGPTFTGFGGTGTFSSKAEVDLMVDLNDDNYGGTVSFLSNLNLKAEAYDYQVYYIGSQYLHVWKVYAEMTFTHVNPGVINADILGIGFKEGVLTSWSPNSYTLGETMTLQDSQSADQSIYMNSLPLLKGIGVPQEYLDNSRDLAFTFTNVRSATSNGNPNNLVNISKEGIFKDDWKAEGSFSASASLK
ncbi:hypothetical protein [Ruminiclostridium cellobioparum]|uniref:hypothetical protein n=1 Tax=Ruminiclostridium cellobioparum TaxID=29355 RepID=UPI00048863D7|nr:hypothetical protein [Ruminiclostridium cellobioparum]